MADAYVSDIADKIREVIPDKVPVYHIGTPPGVQAPRTFVTYSFASPTWVRGGAGIVSARKDIHQVMCSVKVDAASADESYNMSQDIFWGLTGFKPTNCGEMKVAVSGAWGRVEGQSRPATFSQSIVFYFNTNLEAR